jgi:hypothetical protein
VSVGETAFWNCAGLTQRHPVDSLAEPHRATVDTFCTFALPGFFAAKTAS